MYLLTFVDIESHESNMTEASIRFYITIAHFEVTILFSSIVMRELQTRPLHGPQILLRLNGTWGWTHFINRKYRKEIQ